MTTPPAPLNVHDWRVGTKLGRTVYIAVDKNNPYGDTFLGIFDSPDVAAYVVQLHNDHLARTLGETP